MIEELKEIIKDQRFKVLLNNPDIWESKDIDYTTPIVERVWLPINDKRLSLHVIHPCEDGEAYMHPHVWESAMYVLPIGGLYEHQIGVRTYDEYGDAGEPKDYVACKQIVEGGMYYEMLEKSAIHSVRPIAQPVFTVMLSGKPIWKENSCKLPKELVPLSDDRKKEILLTFKNYFE
jgi:hypothetical protein